MTQTKTVALIHLLAFSLFTIILAALFASIKMCHEKYENSDLIILSERKAYLDIGLINYFSKSSQIKKILEGDSGNNGSPYFFIYPNNIDIMCSATTIKDNYLCSDINISKSFYLDNSPIYLNERRGSTISNTKGIYDEQNNTVRIFNNEYKLMKRSVILDIKSINKYQNSSTDNKILHKIKVYGNVSLFVLTRPVFVSINGFGAFTVVYESIMSNDKETNMFVSYNSTVKENFFYIKKIENDKLNIYPSTTLDIDDKYIKQKDGDVFIKNVDENTPIVIYYPVFERTLPFVNFDVNSFTLHFNKEGLEKNNIIDKYVSIKGSDIASSDRIQHIQLNNNQKNNFYITITHPSITHKIQLPKDFEVEKFIDYDIIIIYSFDIMIVTCFSKDVNKNEYCFINRYTDNNNSLIFETKKKRLEEQFKALRNDVPHTSIQHLPLLAFKYGYTFPN